jgi:hypothetical protein
MLDNARTLGALALRFVEDYPRRNDTPELAAPIKKLVRVFFFLLYVYVIVTSACASTGIGATQTQAQAYVNAAE